MKFKAPDYKQYFSPMQRRRMSNLVKAGSVCSIECINESGVEKPGAIVVSSSLGNVAESEKFLNKLINEDITLLTPTNFIQSNHNSLGAQISLNYKSHSYNMVYAHKTVSFESALLDACMLLHDNEAETVLVAGIDEITDENCKLERDIGLWKKEPCTNLDILNSNTPGSIPGEGIAFFMLSAERTSNSYARIGGVNMIPYSDTTKEVREKLSAFLSTKNIQFKDVDLVLTGNNGDAESDRFTMEFIQEAFPESIHGIYKHLCGEYDTASSFGLWFATRILKSGLKAAMTN